MIMKMNKLVTTSLLGVSLLTTAYAGVVPNMESYKAEITKIRRTETPGKVLSLVQSVDQEIRLDLSVALLKVVADRSHSLLPSTVSSLSSKFPAFAADLAAEASKLAPEYATSIAQAASVSAPAQSHLIAAAVAKQNPSKAVRIARTVSEVLPGRELQIAYYVSQIEPQVSRGLSSELQSGFNYLNQEVVLSSDLLAAAAANLTSIKAEGFQAQKTVAQAEAAELVAAILTKTPEAERAAVSAQLTTLLDPKNKVNLSDIRALSKGESVSVGGTTTSLSTVLSNAGSTADVTTVQLDDTEVATSQTTAKTAVETKVKELVAETAASTTLTAVEKKALITKLAPTADTTAVDDIISAGEANPGNAAAIQATVQEKAGAAVTTNVETSAGAATTADTTVETKVVTDAYGSV